MSEKIMFRGREVVEVEELVKSSCRGCVGIEVCEKGEFNHPSGCSLRNTIYVYAKPPLDVFIVQRTASVAYFACSIGKANIASVIYSSRRAAIRGAERFCQKIGFECRIKGDK